VKLAARLRIRKAVTSAGNRIHVVGLAGAFFRSNARRISRGAAKSWHNRLLISFAGSGVKGRIARTTRKKRRAIKNLWSTEMLVFFAAAPP
jgi:hypothetical protein